MIFTDKCLARRLEAAGAATNVDEAVTHAQLRPENGATVMPVAGGFAVFSGVDSPLTQAVGLGMDAPVSEADVDAMEKFYRARGAAVNVEVCPLADATLPAQLMKRGYRFDDFTNTLFQSLPASDDPILNNSEVIVRRVTGEDAEAWSRAVAVGFVGESSPTLEGLAELGRTTWRMKTAVCWMAEVSGRVAGGGCVLISEGVALLSGTSVLPEFRSRGIQSALIRARLVYSAAHGCDIATVGTTPGSSSERNVQRHGFRVAYTRVKLSKSWQAAKEKF